MTIPTPQTVDDGSLFIDGKFQPADSGETVQDINPATEQPLCEVAWAGTSDLDRAVQAARRAFDLGPWPGMPAKERGRLLLRIADGIEGAGEELARLETLDVGKPITFTRGFDVRAAAEIFRYYAGMVEQLEGAARPAGARSLQYTRREPVGVVGAITPFNFPLNLAVNKIAPALAAGNTIVHKPAEQTPLTALVLARVMAEAGLPEGVHNVVTGDGATVGAALVEHPGIDKISFTGSTATGKRLIAAAAGTLKKVTVELGGKGANIVFGDADIEAAVQAAFQAGFFNTGQFCMSGSRLLVHRSVHDQVVEALTGVLGAVPVGDPLDENTVLGPLAHRQQLDKVVEYVGIGRAEGATVAYGGERGHDGPGYFHQPTLFTGANPQMRIAQEEIFGPVVTVLPFDTDEEAVEIANGTPYGLAAGLHTSDVRRAHTVAARLQAGIVWVNTWAAFENSTSFGGYKSSGYGRELGPEGIEEYLQYKTVYVNVD
ncbi:aldehyde dehydrogenase family protein [Streptomyces sp. NPDC058319]|uniref:aldehyde dehydrogenase family protein n=1 Tax=unclassified Streptomyces TaxID=2593676 RepID=UPI0007DE3049|nr:aldehyde dehydrogenase family protein [Streptomyces sp. SAT1]ANH94681.1 betaine-aldehyde dehydrogenase [Streptomyces sp. SAT1]